MKYSLKMAGIPAHIPADVSRIQSKNADHYIATVGLGTVDYS
jgi:hypothetical protein